MENTEKNLSQNNVFIKDCKMWLTYVIATLSGSFSFVDYRIILLHVLRTKGIGTWGVIFIQWNDSYDWNDDVLEHYLISLTCLLSPVEELESKVKSKLESIAFLEEQLQKLEREDWIVVHEDDLPDDVTFKRSASHATLKSIILLESDYLGLVSQFRVKDVFETLCFKYSQENEKNPFKLISVAHHICLILIRGIHVVPKDYSEVIRHLGDHISYVAYSLGECLARFTDEGVDVLISDQLQSTVAVEFDAFVERLFLRLIGIKRKPVWETVSSLPFDKCTVSGKNRIADSLAIFFHNNICYSEVIYICRMVRNLFLAESVFSTTSNSDIDRGSSTHEIVKCIYKFTFVKEETRSAFANFGHKCIYDISCSNNDILSHILGWIRDDSNVLELMDIQEFCSKLPWGNLRAKKTDLLLLQSMLRDPESTLKAQIAMLVLESLNWGYSFDGHLSLYIPRYLHLEMGKNIYLKS